METVDIPDVINEDFAQWYKSDKSRPMRYFQEAKSSFDAGNPTISHADLEKIFSKAMGIDHELVLFNPMLEVGIASTHVRNRHKQIITDLISKLKLVSTSELEEKYQELSEDDAFVDFLSYLQDGLFDGAIEWDSENTASTFLMESYVILSQDSKEKKSVLNDFFPETYRFVSKLIQNKIAEPYLFWTLSDDAEDYFNRCALTYVMMQEYLQLRKVLQTQRLSLVLYIQQNLNH